MKKIKKIWPILGAITAITAVIIYLDKNDIVQVKPRYVKF